MKPERWQGPPHVHTVKQYKLSFFVLYGQFVCSNMNTKRECLFSVFCLCSFTFLNKTTDCSFNAKPITLMNPVIRFECSGGLKRLRRAAAVFQCWRPFGVWAELLVSLSLCWSSSALITAVIINCVDDDDDVTACRLTCVCFQREPTSQPVSTTS